MMLKAGMQNSNGLRNVRYTEGTKEYEVQFHRGGPWIWEALVNIPPTELIYEFERVRLGFDRLAMMVQEELEEEEVKDDGQE
ncbi:unnamed protein product [Aphanomyces euteiches]